VLLVDFVALVHANRKLGELSSFEEAHAKYIWKDAMGIGSKPIVESIIDSNLVAYRSIKEYMTMLLDSLRRMEK